MTPKTLNQPCRAVRPVEGVALRLGTGVRTGNGRRGVGIAEQAQQASDEQQEGARHQLPRGQPPPETTSAGPRVVDQAPPTGPCDVRTSRARGCGSAGTPVPGLRSPVSRGPATIVHSVRAGRYGPPRRSATVFAHSRHSSAKDPAPSAPRGHPRRVPLGRGTLAPQQLLHVVRVRCARTTQAATPRPEASSGSGSAGGDGTQWATRAERRPHLTCPRSPAPVAVSGGRPSTRTTGGDNRMHQRSAFLKRTIPQALGYLA